MFFVLSCNCLCAIYWSLVLSREWRCSCSSADKWCSNYIWVVNNFTANLGVLYYMFYSTVCRTQLIDHCHSLPDRMTCVGQGGVCLNYRHYPSSQPWDKDWLTWWVCWLMPDTGMLYTHWDINMIPLPWDKDWLTWWVCWLMPDTGMLYTNWYKHDTSALRQRLINMVSMLAHAWYRDVVYKLI